MAAGGQNTEMDTNDSVTKIDIKHQEEENTRQPADFETAIALTGYGRFNYLLMLAALPASCVSVFDSSTMSFILPSAECELSLTNVDKGLLNAITYAGMILSAFMWGFLSDTLGRKKILVAGYLLDATVCVLSSFAPSTAVMLALRFVSGFIASGPYAVVMSFLAEFHGAQYRARIIMVTGIFVSLGNILIAGMAWLLIPPQWSVELLDGYLTYNSWRLFVAVCSLPSLLAGLLLSVFHESPKFLMSRGQNEAALQVFRKVYALNTGCHPEDYPVKVLVDEIPKNPIHYNVPKPGNKDQLGLLKVGWSQMKPLFRSPYVSTATLIFSIQFGCLVGMNTIRLWLPQLFTTVEGFSDNRDIRSDQQFSFCEMLNPSIDLLHDSTNFTTAAASNMSERIKEDCVQTPVKEAVYMNSVIIGGVSAVFYLGGGLIINALGKKKLLIICFFLAGVCGITVYWSRNGGLTLSLLSIFLALVGVNSTTMLSVVVDVFPTSLRAMAVSLMMMFGRMGGLLGNIFFPVLLEISCDITFFCISAITLIAGALCFLLPVTKGKALE